MIESLQKTRADFERAYDRHDDEKVVRLSSELCTMLAQEIIMAFGGVSIADSVVILAACKLTGIFVKDAGKKFGLSAETLEAGADELAEFANKNTTRIEVYCVEPTEPETAVEAKAETVLRSTASVRYALTAAERNEIERIVMAEAGAERIEGNVEND